jgi:hypothetical protein
VLKGLEYRLFLNYRDNLGEEITVRRLGRASASTLVRVALKLGCFLLLCECVLCFIFRLTHEKDNLVTVGPSKRGVQVW